MSTPAPVRRVPARPVPAGPPAGSGRARGIATIVASASSNQVGAAVGSHAFATIGPVGVVAVRQLVAALVLLPTVRPPVRRFTWGQWWPVLALGLVFAGMNLGLYTAVDRVGLGLAVTLEFLGPLAIALLGARRLLDLALAVTAGAGVVLLVSPGPSTDWIGIGAGVGAATCWAAYIVLNRLVGTRLPGLQATAAASGCAALLTAPVLVVVMAVESPDPWVLLAAVTSGVLSSVVPYALDLTALRSVPPRAFGVLSSVHPVLAVVVGMVLLQQVPAGHELAGTGVVVLANVVAVATMRGR